MLYSNVLVFVVKKFQLEILKKNLELVMKAGVSGGCDIICLEVSMILDIPEEDPKPSIRSPWRLNRRCRVSRLASRNLPVLQMDRWSQPTTPAETCCRDSGSRCSSRGSDEAEPQAETGGTSQPV